MSRTLYLVFVTALLIGIQPVFAQDGAAVSTGETIDLELASDDEFAQSLEASTDIEMINKNQMEQSEKQSAEQPALAEETAADTPAIAEEPAADTEKLADAEPADAVADKPAEAVLAKEPPAEEKETTDDIRNNEYFLESQRLALLAQEAYDYGDYDAAANFANEASRYAELSDEYVAQRTGTAVQDKTISLPASYTVRTWDISKDCFWNIAAQPWVYGNPRQWRVLYDANKSKLDDPNNPNVIEPGVVLVIPSIKGETRQGAWDSNKTYPPLN